MYFSLSCCSLVFLFRCLVTHNRFLLHKLLLNRLLSEKQTSIFSLRPFWGGFYVLFLIIKPSVDCFIHTFSVHKYIHSCIVDVVLPSVPLTGVSS